MSRDQKKFTQNSCEIHQQVKNVLSPLILEQSQKRPKSLAEEDDETMLCKRVVTKARGTIRFTLHSTTRIIVLYAAMCAS